MAGRLMLSRNDGGRFCAAGMEFRPNRLFTRGVLIGVMCPGSPRPGWRAPPCGRVFRVDREKPRL